MSKKSKTCHGREIFNRMNYLHQASRLLADRNPILSCYYGNLCKLVGKKAVLRMEPDMKRGSCNRCSIALKPGITADIQINEKNEKLFEMKCRKCYYVRNYVIKENYSLWIDNPKAVVEVYGRGAELEDRTSDLSIETMK